MAKSDNGLLDPDYVPVAIRVARFYERYPEGRIVTRLISRDERAVTFEARVYRSAAERRPAATGWASEREGDGDINTVACLENTETSAVGRALANLGFLAVDRRANERLTASAGGASSGSSRAPVPSLSAPAVLRVVRETRLGAEPTPRPVDAELQQRAAIAHDLLGLLARAEAAGLRRQRVDRVRARLLHDELSVSALERIERSLRGWLVRRETAPRDGP